MQTLQDHCTKLVSSQHPTHSVTDSLKTKEVSQIPHLKLKIANNISDYISDNAKVITFRFNHSKYIFVVNVKVPK